MGSKTTTQKTELPEETPEQREQMAMVNAMIDAQLSTNYDRQEATTFVFNKQGEIDQIQKEIDQLRQQLPTNPGQIQGQIDQRMRLMDELKKEGGSNKIDISYTEKPEVKERRLRQEAALDKVNAGFYAAAEKLTKGDYSVTNRQRQQIDALIGDNFQNVIDELTVQFDSAEGKVNEALNRLVDAGKTDIANAAVEQRRQLKQESELLGRSFSDTDFQQRQQQFEQGSLESLYKTASAQGAAQIADLGKTRALSIGGVKENEALARFNLLQSAAQPLAGFGSGAQFAQLQGALNAQQNSNILGLGGLAQGSANIYNNARISQPTTTTTTPVSALDILGGLIGVGAGTAGAVFAGRRR